VNKIREAGTIVPGVREAARPFSCLTELKQPVGYSVDLCMKAVAEIKREPDLADLTVQYKRVTGPERIPKPVDGGIDRACGSATRTKARQEQVDFSDTFFVAAMRVMARKDRQVEAVQDLNGLKIALSQGTTSKQLFLQLQGGGLQAQLQTLASNTDAHQALKEGRVSAFAQDDSLLMGPAANDQALNVLGVSALALSVEPCAAMVRKGMPTCWRWSTAPSCGCARAARSRRSTTSGSRPTS